VSASSVAPSASTRRITRERIEAAARAIDPVFLNTPQWVREPLGGELGLRIALKAETLNPIRSFI
jgi:threonine dehydratase